MLWKPTISTVEAIHVESWNHEELRHVGLTPRALCELKSPAVKCILPFDENDFAVDENDFVVIKLILPYCEIDFAVMKLTLRWRN